MIRLQGYPGCRIVNGKGFLIISAFQPQIVGDQSEDILNQLSCLVLLVGIF